MPELKVGVLGLGAMGKNHVRVLSNMDSVSEVKVFDPVLGRGSRFMGLAVEKTMESFLDSDLDYCVVSTPTANHESVSLLLAQLRIPALVEKPIAVSAAEGRRMLDAFSRLQVLGAVGHIERYNPAAIGLKQRIDEGMLGKIFQVTTTRVGPFTGRIKDVGVIKDLASHDIHLVGWLTGQGYLSVESRTASLAEGPHEDSLLAIGTLTDGTLFSHVVNWVSPAKERRTTVLGENGLMVADTLSGNLFFYENGTNKSNWDSLSQFRGTTEGPVHKFELAKEEPLVAEHLAFQGAVKTGDTSNIVSLEEALSVIEIADRLIISGGQ